MMNLLRYSFRRSVLLLLFLLPMAVMAVTKPHVQRVYMFGFAASFTDSIAYQTDVQVIDSAWVEGKHGFLLDRALYGLQLQYYVEGQLKNSNVITSIFYHKNPRKLQKLWNKVQKRYTKAEGLELRRLSKDQFFFSSEEYKPIINEEVTVPQQQPKSQDKAGKKPSSKKKK